MAIVFVDRPPTEEEFQKFRLILSTFQDGSGMLDDKKPPKWMKDHNAKTLPGWRDFERSVALAFGGIAIESKHIYDVILASPDNPSIVYGLSCKMRDKLRRVLLRDGRVTIEVANAEGDFWDAIIATGLTRENYHTNPSVSGIAIINLVDLWHTKVSHENGGNVDNSKSMFITLQWYKNTGNYQLFQFPIDLPNPHNITWRVNSRRLIGEDDRAIIFEWYPFSGGQLKYYPLSSEAIWKSDVFQLEPLPDDLGHIAINKAATYFPEIWHKVSAGGEAAPE